MLPRCPTAPDRIASPLALVMTTIEEPEEPSQETPRRGTHRIAKCH